MITATLMDLFFGMFRVLFGSFELFHLPTQLASSLTTILVYGNWIVGVDIMALFVGSILFWWVFHMSIGLICWVWKMLPFT